MKDWLGILWKSLDLSASLSSYEEEKAPAWLPPQAYSEPKPGRATPPGRSPFEPQRWRPLDFIRYMFPDSPGR